MHETNCKQTAGGCMPCEVKLAVTLRTLAGGSCLGMILVHDVSCKHSHTTFVNVIKDWINRDDVTEINMFKCLVDEGKMKATAANFAKGSDGAFLGCTKNLMVGLHESNALATKMVSEILERPLAGNVFVH